MPDGSSVCPACGKLAQPVVSGGSPSSVGGLSDNIAGMLAYVTIIPPIIFLVTAPYNRNRFIRFHSFQSIFFMIAWMILWAALHVIASIPFFGWATMFLWPLVGLAGLVIWIILLLKASQGQTFKLPVIGDLAEKQAAAA